jgi:hypothetical protein
MVASWLTNHDRWFLVQLYRWFPPILKVLTIIRPETLVRWHRAGFRCYWCWKSRRRGGRPQIDTELRALIRLMSTENSFWGAPRIHGELLKLGFEVAQSSVAKYMVKRRGPPSQGWRAFLRNHAQDIVAMDLFCEKPEVQSLRLTLPIYARLHHSGDLCQSCQFATHTGRIAKEVKVASEAAAR